MKQMTIDDPCFKYKGFKEFLEHSKTFYPNSSEEDFEKVYFYLNKGERNAE